jgi:RNA polymerase sigma factor (sigma-70 family)
LATARASAGRPGEDADTARLVERFQAGERAVGETLYARYCERVYLYAHVVLGDHHAAEDVTQHVFERMLDRLAAFELRSGAEFRAWLFVVARNEALGHLRRRKWISVTPLEELEDHRLATLDGFAHSLDWLRDPDVAREVAQLPQRQKRLIVLRFVAGVHGPGDGRDPGRVRGGGAQDAESCTEGAGGASASGPLSPQTAHRRGARREWMRAVVRPCPRPQSAALRAVVRRLAGHARATRSVTRPSSG